MNKLLRASGEKEANIMEAEGHKQAAIAKAEGEKQSAILEAGRPTNKLRFCRRKVMLKVSDSLPMPSKIRSIRLMSKGRN